MTLARIAAIRMAKTMTDAAPFDLGARRYVLHDRRVSLLLKGGRDAEDEDGDGHRHVGLDDGQRADAGDPHHGGGGVADHAAGAAGVGGGDDGGEIADVHLAAEHLARHHAADQGRGDVVEEARQHAHDHQQQEGALPVVGQEGRHDVGQLALLEMPREQREAHQQQEQIGEDHPLVPHMQRKAAEAGAELEAGEGELVGDDGGEAGERDLQGVLMEEGDAQQRRGEQDEIDGNAEEVEGLRRGLGGRGQGRATREEKERGESGDAGGAAARRGLRADMYADDVWLMACSPRRIATPDAGRTPPSSTESPCLNPPLADAQS